MLLDFKGWSLNENNSYLSGVDDIEVVAATIIGEAGGESEKGMIAIKNVLDNRASNKKTSAAGEPHSFKGAFAISTRADGRNHVRYGQFRFAMRASILP